MHDCWDSSVATVTGYGMDGWGSFLGMVKKFFSIPCRPDRLWGPHSLLSNGYRGLFPRVKQLEREADHIPPSSAEFRNGGAIRPLPHTSSWHSA
jgi:hypothetical protein